MYLSARIRLILKQSEDKDEDKKDGNGSEAGVKVQEEGSESNPTSNLSVEGSDSNSASETQTSKPGDAQEEDDDDIEKKIDAINRYVPPMQDGELEKNNLSCVSELKLAAHRVFSVSTICDAAQTCC